APRVSFHRIRQERGRGAPGEERDGPALARRQAPSGRAQQQRKGGEPGREHYDGLPEEALPPRRQRARDEAVRQRVGGRREPEGSDLDEGLAERAPQPVGGEQVLPLHREEEVPARHVAAAMDDPEREAGDDARQTDRKEQ